MSDTPIIIDDGSGMCKAGFAGQDTPKAVFPSIIGLPREPNTEQKGIYIGNEALANRGVINLEYPLERGIITNWDHIEFLWQHTFSNELSTAPSEHPVILTDVASKP